MKVRLFEETGCHLESIPVFLVLVVGLFVFYMASSPAHSLKTAQPVSTCGSMSSGDASCAAFSVSATDGINPCSGSTGCSASAAMHQRSALSVSEAKPHLFWPVGNDKQKGRPVGGPEPFPPKQLPVS